MKLLIIFQATCLTLLAACYAPLKDPYIFDISFEGRDTCFFKRNSDTALLFFRKVEILENSITDTFRFGLAVVPGGYTGRMDYLQVEDRTDAMVYQDENARNMMPKADRLCFQRHHPDKMVSGRIKIKVYTK
jgi:hypothetical protein